MAAIITNGYIPQNPTLGVEVHLEKDQEMLSKMELKFEIPTFFAFVFISPTNFFIFIFEGKWR